MCHKLIIHETDLHPQNGEALTWGMFLNAFHPEMTIGFKVSVLILTIKLEELFLAMKPLKDSLHYLWFVTLF